MATDSLYRRLTDLGTDAECAALGLPDCSTTDEAIAAGREPRELAAALLTLAERANRKTLVALLSEAQAQAIREGGRYGERVLLTLRECAQKTPQPRRLTDLSYRRIFPAGHGEPAHVVRLVDGEPPRRSTRESRRERQPRRYTLSAEAIQVIARESERRGVSASQVVDEAVMAIEGG